MLNLRTFTALAESVESPCPWGFDVTLRIYRADRPGWRDFRQSLATEPVRRNIQAERRTQARLKAETKGRRARAVDLDLAGREAEIYLQELRMDELAEEVSDHRLRAGMAEHLFEIIRCNLYGVPVPDTPENRLRLLTDIRMPRSGDPRVWHDRASEGIDGVIWLPAYLPADNAELGRWITCLRDAGEDLARARDAWRGSPLEPVAYVRQGETGANLHDLMTRWVEEVAYSHAAYVAEQLEGAEDFLPAAPPTSGASTAGAVSPPSAGATQPPPSSSGAAVTGGATAAAPNPPPAS